MMGRWTKNKQLGSSSGEKHLPSRYEPWIPSTSTAHTKISSTQKKEVFQKDMT